MQYVCWDLVNTCFSGKKKKMLQNNASFFECLFLFFVCMIPPTDNLLNSILTSWVASWCDSVLWPWKPANELGQDRRFYLTWKALSIKKHLYISWSTYSVRLAFHCQVCSFPLRLLNPATRVCTESEEGAVETTLSKILNLDCNH